MELFKNPREGQVHAVNRALWIRIFKKQILPFMGNYWLGEENSILVIDNASIHWGDNDSDVANELARLVEERGGRVFFTPPFCPDANAIEWVFGEMNKEIANDRETAKTDPERAILFGLLKGGQSALPFILKSDEIVRSWFDPTTYGTPFSVQD